LVFVEYEIVGTSLGSVGVALRETPVWDDNALAHMLVRNVTNDPDTGVPVINYQPFSLRPTDLPLMTGLTDTWFEYLDLNPEKGTGPVWRPDWKSTSKAPYPDAIRLRWERGRQAGEEIIHLWAKVLPQSTSTP
jgi:hypothetical protein